MLELIPPFLSIDGGDVSAHSSVDKMIADIEPIDALDGEHEFFDAQGTPLVALASEAGWRVVPSGAAPEPERLEELLRFYFISLPPRYASFTARAAVGNSLAELSELRLELWHQRWWRSRRR